MFRRFAELTTLCFGVLLLAYLLIDVMDNLKWFTRYGSTPSEILRYYAARLPLLVSRVLPLALVAAAALTTSLFVASGELLGMRACGISAARTVTPIVASCMLLAAFYHLLANEWTPHASALASRIKNTEIKNRSATRHSVWHRSSGSLYEIAWLDPLAGVAEGVTFYELGHDGLPVSRTTGRALRNMARLCVLRCAEHGITQGTSTARGAGLCGAGRRAPGGSGPGDLPCASSGRRSRRGKDGYDATPLEGRGACGAPSRWRRRAPARPWGSRQSGALSDAGQRILVSFAMELGAACNALGASLGTAVRLPPADRGLGSIRLVECRHLDGLRRAAGGARKVSTWVARDARNRLGCCAARRPGELGPAPERWGRLDLERTAGESRGRDSARARCRPKKDPSKRTTTGVRFADLPTRGDGRRETGFNEL